MDGAYVTIERQSDLREFLGTVYESMAELFCETEKEKFKYLIRSAVSYGPVIHARKIPDSASKVLSQNKEYRASILLGPAVIQACTAERLAPPFGIYIHESARSFAPNGEHSFEYRWFDWLRGKSALKTKFSASVKESKNWLLENAHQNDYSRAKIETHFSLLQEYLNDN